MCTHVFHRERGCYLYAHASPDVSTHALYLDDSGTKDYASEGQVYGDGISRHFVFGGLLASVDEAGRLASKLISLKLRHFDDEDVEIKSNWLRRPTERERRYLSPYCLTNATLDAFVEEVYQILEASEAVLMASVVDKQAVQTLFPTPLPPVQLAYDGALLLAGLGRAAADVVSVAVDDMTGAAPGETPHKQLLLERHDQLKRIGSPIYRGASYHPLGPALKFKNSASSHLIQLADLVAYNIYQEVTHRACGRISPEQPWPDSRYLARCFALFDTSLLPHGIVRYPLSREDREAIGESLGQKKGQAVP